MTRRRIKAVRAITPPLCAGRRDQKGISLLLALIFVAFFGAILVTIARFSSFEVRKIEARVAGWELVEIAKAARLYMRDRYAADATLRATAATPTSIPLATLIADGYLPGNFGRVDAGGQQINALNMPVFIIMANWGPNGIASSPTDPATVPSAFVYYAPGGKGAKNLTVEMVAAIRKENVAITAPLFDSTDTNVSADCRGGGPAAAIWDTGCLRPDEFAALVAPLGGPTVLEPGALIMPAWKAVQPDLRAVLRFPQPENPGYATMLTDLGMGTPTGDCSLTSNQVQFTATNAAGATYQETTNVCDALSDSATTDLRYNINHVANIQAQRLVAMPQTADFGGDTNVFIGNGNDDSMRVNGNIALGSDLRVYNTRALPAGVNDRFNVPNGTLVVERNAYAYSNNVAAKGHALIGSISEANALVSDRLDTPTFDSISAGTTTGPAQMNVTTSTNLSGNMMVRNFGGGVTAELITDTMTGNSAQVHVTDSTGTQAQITNTLNLSNSTATVVGSTPIMNGGVPSAYTAIAGEIADTGTINVTSAQPGGSNADLQFLAGNALVSAGTTSNADRNAPLPIINTTGRCLEGANVANACADRQYVPPNITP